MEKKEFKRIIALYEQYWSVQFDDFKINAWYEPLKECNYYELQETITKLVETEEFPPKIATIIKLYRVLHNERVEKRNKARQQETLSLIDKQNQGQGCILCNEFRGLVIYYTNFEKTKLSHSYTEECSYKIYARCECAYGEDPRIFGTANINKMVCSKLNEKRKSENKSLHTYIATFREAVGEEFYRDRLLLIKEQQFEKSSDIDFKEVQMTLKKDIQQSLDASEYPNKQ